MKRAVPLALLLLLAACAVEQASWTRPGISRDQAASDFATCRAQARASVNQALANEATRLDMMAGPPTLSGQSSNIVQSLQRDQLASDARKREAAETTACMRSKGYYQS